MVHNSRDPASQMDHIEVNQQPHLLLRFQPAFSVFMFQALLVYSLQKPRAQSRMHLHRCIDNGPGDLVDVHEDA